MDYKPAIVHAFTQLYEKEQAQKEAFKARAYRTILQQIAPLPAIHSMDDLAAVRGIGPKIKEKLAEIFHKGSLRVSAPQQQQPLETLDVYGIGPVKAKALQQQGIRTVAELRDAVQRDPALLNDKQRIGLQYYEDLLQRIPRQEMMEHERQLSRDAPYPIELVGSYRRQAADSGDIDVLLRLPAHETPKAAKQAFYAYVEQLQRTGYLQEILALGEHKCMAIVKISDRPEQPEARSRRLDLLVTPDHEYACALLYFTGSNHFNVSIRTHALEMGYTLNEHALTPLRPDVPQPPPFPTERDLFEFLGWEYVEPGGRSPPPLEHLKTGRT